MLAISKIVHCAYLSSVPKFIVEKLEKIQLEFLWDGKRAKISSKTLCNKFIGGGLQKVDIQSKVDALQLSWIKRLYDDNEHQWKKIPRALLIRYYGQFNVFYPHFSSEKRLPLMPIFYKSIIANWANYSSEPIDVRNIYGQFLWYNSYIRVAGHTVLWKAFLDAGLTHLGQLCADHVFKTWNQVRQEFQLHPNLQFKFFQLMNAIPVAWKNKIAENLPVPNLDEAMHSQGLLLCTRLLQTDKLTSRQLSDIRIRNASHIPTAQVTLQNKFPNVNANDWKTIYLIYRKATRHAYARNFQYKILNNVLYLNKRLALFGLATTANCSFCGRFEETVDHLFAECSCTIVLWQSLTNHFNGLLVFPPLNPQNAHLGYLEEVANFLLINQILLIFKIFIYNSREIKTLSLAGLLAKIKKTYMLEIKAEDTLRCDDCYSSKWRCIAEVLR